MNFIKKTISIVIAFVLTATFIVPLTAVHNDSYAMETEQAAEVTANSWRYKNGQLCVEEETQKTRAVEGRASNAWQKVNGKFYNSKGQEIVGAIKKGVDVSYHNGKIDWNKVKTEGIDFAILRCGYGSNETKYDDSTFDYNAKECERLGIPYGVFLYSYADDCTDDPTSEAEHVLRLIKNRKIDYPIYYDLEDDALTESMTNDEIVKCAQIFCDAIETCGYDAGIYANLYWWNNVLNSSKLDKYEKWVAQYNYKCDYKKTYRIWQYTSLGSVNGVYSEGLDVNLEFDLGDGKYGSSGASTADRPQKETPGWHSTSDGKKYYINSSNKRVTGYKKIGSYYYFFDSKGIMKTGTIKSGDKKYVLDSKGKATLYTTKTKTSLNYRTGSSTKYKIKGTLKKGKTVSIIREKSGWGEMSNGYWIKLSYTKKITKYPQFVPYKAKTTYALNYRTGPGTNYKKKGTFKKGTILNIVNSKNGWGKTKSGYWVKLEYTKRI